MMAQMSLSTILDHLDALRVEELCRLEEAVRARLTARDRKHDRAAFHQALLASGLLREVAPPRQGTVTERTGVQITGKPISETILEERR